jgi:hypothetical protein
MCGSHSHLHSVEEFKAVAKHAYEESDWADKSPARPAEKRQMKHFLHCPRENAYDRMRAILDRQKSDWKQEREYQLSIRPPGPIYLARLRACESDGNYRANTGNGFYGAYQFDLGTWNSVGGSGYPHNAKPREQDYRAAKLYRMRGSSPWPLCG